MTRIIDTTDPDTLSHLERWETQAPKELEQWDRHLERQFSVSLMGCMEEDHPDVDRTKAWGDRDLSRRCGFEVLDRSEHAITVRFTPVEGDHRSINRPFEVMIRADGALLPPNAELLA